MNNEIKKMDPQLFEYAFQYLQRFMALTKQEVELLLHYCEFRHFKRKEIIVKEGETDNYLSIVIKGLVRKFIKVKNNEVILQLATEGHVIQSEISFLTRAPSLVILETLESTTLISISHKNMEEALEKFPMGERLGRLILTRMYIKKDEKRYEQLSKSTRERFLHYNHLHPHMLQRVPQKYLASYLNIKPETFSRLKHFVGKRP